MKGENPSLLHENPPWGAQQRHPSKMSIVKLLKGVHLANRWNKTTLFYGETSIIRDVPIRSRNQKSGLITLFPTRLQLGH